MQNVNTALWNAILPRNSFTHCLIYELNHFGLYADNFLPLNVRSAYLNWGSRRKKESRRKPPKSCQRADKEVVSISLCAFKRWDYHCSRYLSTSFLSYSLFCKKDLLFLYRSSLYRLSNTMKNEIPGCSCIFRIDK